MIKVLTIVDTNPSVKIVLLSLINSIFLDIKAIVNQKNPPKNINDEEYQTKFRSHPLNEMVSISPDVGK